MVLLNAKVILGIVASNHFGVKFVLATIASNNIVGSLDFEWRMTFHIIKKYFADILSLNWFFQVMFALCLKEIMILGPKFSKDILDFLVTMKVVVFNIMKYLWYLPCRVDNELLYRSLPLMLCFSHRRIKG